MQSFKISTSPRIFYTYIQPINHVYETRFSAHNFKQPNASEKYVKFSIIYLGPKLWDNYLLTAEKFHYYLL